MNDSSKPLPADKIFFSDHGCEKGARYANVHFTPAILEEMGRDFVGNILNYVDDDDSERRAAWIALVLKVFFKSLYIYIISGIFFFTLPNLYFFLFF
jgi:hypothetical protein